MGIRSLFPIVLVILGAGFVLYTFAERSHTEVSVLEKELLETREENTKNREKLKILDKYKVNLGETIALLKEANHGNIELKARVIELETENTNFIEQAKKLQELIQEERLDADHRYHNAINKFDTMLDGIATALFETPLWDKNSEISFDKKLDLIVERFNDYRDAYNKKSYYEEKIRLQDETISTLSNEVTRLRGILKFQSEKIDELERQHKANKSTIARITKERDHYSRELKYIQGRINSLESEKSKLEDQLSLISSSGSLNVHYYFGNRKFLIDTGFVRKVYQLGARVSYNHLRFNHLQGWKTVDNFQREIKLPKGNYKLIDSHKHMKYNFVQHAGYTSLILHDPSEFWNAGRYLVLIEK